MDELTHDEIDRWATQRIIDERPIFAYDFVRDEIVQRIEDDRIRQHQELEPNWTDPDEIPATFTGDLKDLPKANHGGDCPYCGKSYYLDVQERRFGVCDEHTVYWRMGWNQSSSRPEDEETWRQNAKLLRGYHGEIVPWLRYVPPPPPPDKQRCSECGQLLDDSLRF